jgi:hypothetical protein
MTYKIILYDYTLEGYKQTHKKSGMYYWRLETLWNSKERQILEFKSVYEAKCFLLSNSSFPKFFKHMISQPAENILDKLINKGKYSFKNLYNFPPELKKNNLLCEFEIVEITNENI